ncbi:MAG TPA: hypothetical protein VKG86_06215 [Terracidiphilus sp.]|nr:hypothetical protein [Terracidiphilus sp.]
MSIVSHAFRRVQPFIQSFLDISSLQKYCGLPHVASFLVPASGFSFAVTAIAPS